MQEKEQLLLSPFPIALKIHQSHHSDRKVPMALREFRDDVQVFLLQRLFPSFTLLWIFARQILGPSRHPLKKNINIRTPVTRNSPAQSCWAGSPPGRVLS